MARTFGTNANVKMSVGGCALTGAFTIVMVIRRNSNGAGYHNLLTAQTSALAGSQYGLEIESNGDGNQLQIQSGNTGFTASTFTVTTTDSWCLVAGGKASGTTTPRMHKYVYGTDTWTHQNAGGALGNPSSVSGGVLSFGEWENGLDDYDGDIAAAAIFDRNLSDAEVEQLAHSLQGWLAAAPVGMWVFDQAATSTAVNDWTGGGANQSTIASTSVATSSVPGLSYGHAPAVLSSSASAGGGGSTVSGTADASLTFGTTVAGQKTVTGTATRATTVSATASGHKTVFGTATRTTTAGTAASGTRTTAGTAARATTFAGNATGQKTVHGQADRPTTFSAPAAGSGVAETVTGTATAPFTFTGTVAGTRTVRGAGSRATTFGSPAIGQRAATGTAAAALAITGSAVGHRRTYGSATAVLAFAAPATGPASSGTVVRPNTGTTTRPDTGRVIRPNTGTVTRP